MLRFNITTLFYSIHLGILYGPPDGNVLQLTQELADVLEQDINSTGELLLLGDLNFQVNCDNNQDTTTLLDTLKNFGLNNHAIFPTHQLQKTLDLINIQDTSSLISQTSQVSLLSDHNIIHYKLQTTDRIINLQEISYRKLKAINMDHLKEDISEIPYHRDCNSPGTCEQLYINSLTTIIDKHAPSKKILVSNKPKVPWFNDIIAAEMRKRRLEKIWQKDNNNNTFISTHKEERYQTSLINLKKNSSSRKTDRTQTKPHTIV